MSKPQTNNYYTNVYQKSFEVFAKRSKKLDPLLIALMVDPLEAEDAKREFGNKIPHSLEDFRSRDGQMAVDAALQTVAQWLVKQESIQMSIPEIAKWNSKLTVWMGIRQVDSFLSFAKTSDPRPREALRLAEEWVRGGDVAKKILRAAEDCYEAELSLRNSTGTEDSLEMDSFQSALAVCRSVLSFYGKDGYKVLWSAQHSTVAINTADIDRYDSGAYEQRRARLKSRLADAIMTFPA